jgi:hypothetical protein
MKELLQFIGQVLMARLVPSREDTDQRPIRGGRRKYSTQEVKLYLITIITWVMLALLVFCSIVGFLVFPLLDKPVPDGLMNLVWISVGYFGGVITTFFGVKAVQ